VGATERRDNCAIVLVRKQRRLWVFSLWLYHEAGYLEDGQCLLVSTEGANGERYAWVMQALISGRLDPISPALAWFKHSLETLC
jgi:hypothetical protein